MSDRNNQSISEMFNEEDNKQFETIIHTIPKRRRYGSDVIDSMGENENISSGCSTPNQPPHTPIDTESPESVNVFRQEWIVRTESDLLDAGLINPECGDDSPMPTISLYTDSNGFNAPMVVSMDSECYNMNHKRRGKCIVFNHEIFDTGFENRDGSTLDAKRIETTFKNLGFNVEICINLKHSQLLNKINELSAENHDDNDCICIFILTHGLAPDMIFAKDVAFRIENIWKPFTADKCRSLAGKPKLFFFQACRGEELDSGIQVCRGITSKSETDSIVASYKLPTYADFLIAHSTVQGFYSWRNPEEGTWFIQCLCDVLEEYHETTDLLKMLTICARRVATRYASSCIDTNPDIHDKKQVPSITSMLIRDLYFTPK